MLAHMENPFCFWSNLLMLFPAFLAYQANLTGIAVATVLAMIASMIYHMDEHSAHGLYVDVAGVVSMVACFFYMVFNSNFLFTYMNIVGSIYINLAFWYYFEGCKALEEEDYDEYQFNHVAWHVLVSFSCAAFIYAFHGSSIRKRPTTLTKPIVHCKHRHSPATESRPASILCAVVHGVSAKLGWLIGEEKDASRPKEISKPGAACISTKLEANKEPGADPGADPNAEPSADASCEPTLLATLLAANPEFETLVEPLLYPLEPERTATRPRAKRTAPPPSIEPEAPIETLVCGTNLVGSDRGSGESGLGTTTLEERLEKSSKSDWFEGRNLNCGVGISRKSILPPL